MSGNTYGKIFRLTTYGESHGKAVGGVIDGCPAGMSIDEAYIKQKLQERQQGCKRNESNEIIWLSGIHNGVTMGTPIAFTIMNNDARFCDYAQEELLLKPSHAHYAYRQKYGYFDHNGGGRASGRETVARVVAGSIAMQYLSSCGISIEAYTLQVGKVKVDGFPCINREEVLTNDMRCPDSGIYNMMKEELAYCNSVGDTAGCQVGCIIKGVPAGVGEPVFEKLSAQLSQAVMSIGAARAFEYGAGMQAAGGYGSQLNDEYNADFSTRHNYGGGISGGIATGEDIYFTVAFKPVPTLMRDVPTVDIYGKAAVLKATGRHDVCLAPRVLPVVESMAALCIINSILEFKAYK